MCSTFMKNVSGVQFPPLDEFPISQTVCYKYYAGRLLVFEEKYSEVRYIMMFGCIVVLMGVKYEGMSSFKE